MRCYEWQTQHAGCNDDYIHFSCFGLQDEHQQARCWFGAGIAQQMQAEHDAALQSLDTAHALCLQVLQQPAAQQQQERLLPDQASEQQQQAADTDKRGPRIHVTAPGNSQQADAAGQKEITAARGLAVKALLAKASILKQLQRTSEANDCMTQAKHLDPSVGKYIK